MSFPSRPSTCPRHSLYCSSRLAVGIPPLALLPIWTAHPPKKALAEIIFVVNVTQWNVESKVFTNRSSLSFLTSLSSWAASVSLTMRDTNDFSASVWKFHQPPNQTLESEILTNFPVLYNSNNFSARPVTCALMLSNCKILFWRVVSCVWKSFLRDETACSAASLAKGTLRIEAARRVSSSSFLRFATATCSFAHARLSSATEALVSWTWKALSFSSCGPGVIHRDCHYKLLTIRA